MTRFVSTKEMDGLEDYLRRKSRTRRVLCTICHTTAYIALKNTPLRIVFDPACPYQGISLNSFLYKEESVLDRKSVWCPTPFPRRISCIRRRHFQDVPSSITARKRLSNSQISMERNGDVPRTSNLRSSSRYVW